MTRLHGHVVRRRDGAINRCGGPRVCPECATERQQLHTVAAALHERCVQHWGRVRILHGADSHTEDARRVLLALDDLGPNLRS